MGFNHLELLIVIRGHQRAQANLPDFPKQYPILFCRTRWIFRLSKSYFVKDRGHIQCRLSFLRPYKQVAYLIVVMSKSNHMVEVKITEAMYKTGRHLVMVSYINNKPPGFYAYLGRIYFLLARCV